MYSLKGFAMEDRLMKWLGRQPYGKMRKISCLFFCVVSIGHLELRKTANYYIENWTWVGVADGNNACTKKFWLNPKTGHSRRSYFFGGESYLVFGGSTDPIQKHFPVTKQPLVDSAVVWRAILHYPYWK